MASSATALADAADLQSFSERTRAAVALLREEKLDAAEQAFDALLTEQPDNALVAHFAGILRHVQGRSEEGLVLMQMAAEALPDNATVWCNLGNVLLECARLDEAEAAYRRSVDAAPDDEGAADALNNLGILCRHQSRPSEAERCLLRALELQPTLAEAWYNLSRVLLAMNRVHEGLLASSRAIVLMPGHASGREDVIRALILLDERERAAVLLREWADEEPDNPVARHALAACLGGSTPDRASDDYVTQVFDSFAQSFDVKLEALGYRAPALIAAALAQVLGPTPQALQVADLGCGTGLVGPLIKPWAARLVGCDLSVGMLRRARLRQVYDALYKVELVHFLDTQPAAFDLLVAADTLCYFGKLEAVFAGVWNALRPGGWFIFTVEALPDDTPDEHRLHSRGRYAHTRRYLERLAATQGLRAHALQPEVLRHEAGLPVQAWLATLQRPA